MQGSSDGGLGHAYHCLYVRRVVVVTFWELYMGFAIPFRLPLAHVVEVFAGLVFSLHFLVCLGF